MSYGEFEQHQAQKRHVCHCCEQNINPTEIYNNVFGMTNEGVVKTLAICLCCSFLQTVKEGDKQGHLIKGEFTEKKIPSRLRKIRNAWYENMPNCVKTYGRQFNEAVEKPRKAEIKKIVVKKAIFNNKIIHIPVTKQYYIDGFKVGQEITLSAGVNGQKRVATIKTVKEVDGKSFGQLGKCIALFLEK